jgi:hypothetical protein
VLVALALPPANEPNDFIVVERASSSIEAKCEDIEMREMNHSVNGRGLALDLRSSDSQPSDPFGAEGKVCIPVCVLKQKETKTNKQKTKQNKTKKKNNKKKQKKTTTTTKKTKQQQQQQQQQQQKRKQKTKNK